MPEFTGPEIAACVIVGTFLLVIGIGLHLLDRNESPDAADTARGTTTRKGA